MVQKYEVAGVATERGEKSLCYLDIGKLADGEDLRMAVHIMAGAKTGPTLCLLATAHGDETLGIDIIQRIFSEVRPEGLSGQIVAVPVVNPLSFSSQTYHTPQDMQNIEGLFPGAIEGSLTAKMASILSKEVIDHVDCILNLHGMGHGVNEFVYVPNFSGKVGKETIELAKAFGLRILYLGPAYPGRCVKYAAETRGIPGIMSEIGADLMWAPDVAKFVGIGVKGVKNVLKYLNMIPGEVERPEQQILLKERTSFRARHGGMFHPEFGLEGLGKVLPKGTLLGRTVNPQTFEEVERITTPYDEGILFAVKGRGRVHPGDFMFHVGNMKTAEMIT